MPDPLKFVNQKNVASELKTCMKNWERKIEITEIAAKKAKNIIKNSGGYAEDVIKPEILTQKFEN